jgi:hypothetical protein
MDDDDCVTDGDGLVDEDVEDIHAAKTATAEAATIGMATRARDAKGIEKSGEGASQCAT